MEMNKSKISVEIVLAAEVNGMLRARNKKAYWTKMFKAIEAIVTFYKKKDNSLLDKFLKEYGNPNLKITIDKLLLSLLGKVDESNTYLEILEELDKVLKKSPVEQMGDAVDAIIVCSRDEINKTNEDVLIIPKVEWMINRINRITDTETNRLMNIIKNVITQAEGE